MKKSDALEPARFTNGDGSNVAFSRPFVEKKVSKKRRCQSQKVSKGVSPSYCRISSLTLPDVWLHSARMARKPRVQYPGCDLSHHESRGSTGTNFSETRRIGDVFWKH